MRKKIIVVPDSFKGCMSSETVAGIIAEAARGAGFEAVEIPIADGGEGSTDCILKILGGRKISKTVHGPDGSLIPAGYGVTEDRAGDGTAIIEIAESSGITRQDSLHPMTANTYGFGELIKDALDRGIRNFLLCLGGSATTDCGLGMAAALGVRFKSKTATSFDADACDRANNGNEIRQGESGTDGEFIPCGKTLGSVDEIDPAGMDLRVYESKFRVMSDVDNPLYGERGAAYVYAPQKGAGPEEVGILDEGLRHVAPLIEAAAGCSCGDVKGAGAAGGSGYGCAAFLKAEISSGIDVMLDLCDFDSLVRDCDLIVTGEGKLDEQSLMGKVLSGIRRRAGDKPVVSFCGVNGLTEPLPEEMKITVVEIGHGISPEESIRNGTKYLKAAAEKFFSDRRV